MDDVSDFQQRLEQFQKGKQFGSVRSVQMGAIQGGSPFTYYPQGMKAGNDRFRAPNAGIAPNFSIGNEKPRFSPNPTLTDSIETGLDRMDKLMKRGGGAGNNQNLKTLKKVKGSVDRSDANPEDEQVDELLGTTAQGLSRRNKMMEDAMNEAATEMGDSSDSKTPLMGKVVGAITSRAQSRMQKRSTGTPAWDNRQRESAKFADPDFDPFT